MTTDERELVLSRTYDAPRALVYEAWTRPEHVDRWWGPDGFRTVTASMDVRPGGEWRYVMRHAEYGEYPNRVRYLEVVAPERLVYDHDAGVDGDPDAMRVVVTFEERGARTEVTLRTAFASAEVLRKKVEQVNAIEAGKQTLARLDGVLRELAH